MKNKDNSFLKQELVSKNKNQFHIVVHLLVQGRNDGRGNINRGELGHFPKCPQ
jgi:hypothetical protein